MNAYFLRFQLNDISGSYLNHLSIQHEFEKMVESESPRKYQYSKSKIGGTSCLQVDPNTGKFLLACGNDGSLGIWSLDDRCRDDELYCKRINFSARSGTDNEPVTLPTNRNAQMVHSFETKKNRFRLYRQSSSSSVPTQSQARPGHRHSIRSCQWFKLDNGMFFTGSNDFSLQLWDTNSLEAVHSVDVGHRVNQIDTTDHYVVVATEDGYPRLTDLRNPTGITHLGSGTMPHEMLTVHCNPQKTHIVATGDSSGSVKLWDLRKRNQLLLELYHHVPRKRAHISHCQDLAWNSDGSQLASIGADGRIYMWSPFNPSHDALQVGPHDLPRTRHLRRTSQRLLWSENYILCNTDYGEIQFLDPISKRLWTKIEDPEPSSTTSPSAQFSGMAIQDKLSNGMGLRLYLSASNSIYEYTP